MYCFFVTIGFLLLYIVVLCAKKPYFAHKKHERVPPRDTDILNIFVTFDKTILNFSLMLCNCLEPTDF